MRLVLAILILIAFCPAAKAGFDIAGYIQLQQDFYTQRNLFETQSKQEL